jgi:hypothetical protein
MASQNVDNNFRIPENKTQLEKRDVNQKAADLALKQIALDKKASESKKAALISAKLDVKNAQDAVKAHKALVNAKKEEQKIEEAKAKMMQGVVLDLLPEEDRELQELKNKRDERLKDVEQGTRDELAILQAFDAQKKVLEENEALRQREAILNNSLAIEGSMQGLVSSLSGLAQVRTNNAVKAAQAEGQSEEQIEAIRKRGFEKQKKYLVAQAVMTTAAGVARAFADHAFPLSAVVAGLVGAAGAVQVGTIQSQKAASGFEGTISQPTTFTVGEEGPEKVSIEPRAKMSAGSDKGSGMTVIIQGDINGEEQFIERIRTANEEIDRRSM